MTTSAPSKTATIPAPDGGVPYRAGVGLVIVNENGDTLACERDLIPGDWQWPQGGRNEGEDALATAWRELYEEVGLEPAHVEYLGKLDLTTIYEFPDYIHKRHRERDGESYVMKYRGQQHEWFIFRLKADTSNIRFDLHEEIEFRAWQWLSAADMAERVVEFKRNAYRDVAAALPTLLAK